MTRKSRHIRRSTLGIFMALVAALAGAGTAFAAWSSSSAPNSTGASAAQSMTAGHAPVLGTTASNITLSWAASPLSSGSSPEGYVVRRYNSFNVESAPGGTCAGTISALTCTDASLVNGTWSYSVTPVLANWKGSESTKSSIALNAAPPAITMTTPTSGSYYRSATWNNISGTASSSTGLASVSLSIRQGSGNYYNGTSFSSASEVLLTPSGTTNWSYAIASSKLSDGAYTVRVVATDTVGNSSTNSTSFNYDNTAPTVSFSLPTYTTNGYSLSSTASGAASVSYYYCAGSSCTATNLIGTSLTSPYSVVWSGQPADGTYKVTAFATDLAGNTGASSDTTVIDNNAPVTTDNTASISSSWKNSTQTVTLSATDGTGSGVASTRYTTNGSTPTASSSSGNSISLSSEGTYTIKYFSTDNAGNVEAVKAGANQINIDKTSPTAASITSLPTFIENGQALTASGADALSGVGSVNYYYCLGTFCTPSTLIGTSTDTASSYSLAWNSQPADGSYRVLARVFDKAGNSKDSSIISTKIDNNAPTISISSPVDGGAYRSTSNWPGSIAGSASDANLSSVGYTFQRVSTGKYWNGFSFSSSTPVTITPSGTTSWSKTFSFSSFPAEDDYVIVATATDAVGNTTTDTSTFAIDVTRPSGVDIQGLPSGTGDFKATSGDQIVYSFSEEMLPSSIKSGWDGTSTNVVANFDNAGNFGNSSLVINNVNLGSIDLGDNGSSSYVSSHGNRFSLNATMVMTVVNGKSVVTVTLTQSSTVTVNQNTTLRWSPSGTPTDPAGNTMLTTTVVESTGPRKNF